MKLTPLFIVRESVSVEVCCCSCCILSFCACICFQKLPKIRTLPDAINARHIYTHKHIFLSVCKEQKDQTRFRHIRHSMLRFVSCCCCCLFYHLTIFSECLHPKNNFVEQLFLVGCRSRKITAHILTLSVSPRIHTHRQTKSGMHKLWALPSKQKTNKSSLWAHILTLSVSLSDCLSASQISELTTADDVALLDSIFYYYSSATAAAAATRTTTRSYFNALFSHKVQRQWW